VSIAAVIAVAAALVACSANPLAATSDASLGPRPGATAILGSIPPDRSSELGTTPAQPTPSFPLPAKVTGLDLRNVDWGEVTVPGDACFRPNPITLHDGAALFPRPQDPPDTGNGFGVEQVDAFINYPSSQIRSPVYAQIEGDGVIDAALYLECSSGGGTDDAEQLFSFAVFSGKGGQLHSLGLITARQQPAPWPPTLMSIDQVATGEIVVEEHWFGPRDGPASPGGISETKWSLVDGVLRPATSVITTRPEGLTADPSTIPPNEPFPPAMREGAG
jgi:hypothetical protein